MQFEQHLKSVVESLVPEMATIESLAIAFSGGIDSSALLFAASRCWPYKKLMAFHINHKLSLHSDEWEYSCHQQAKLLGVDFFSKKLEINNTLGKGLEAAARTERYRALIELSNIHKPALLLFGHHADDQVETIMFRILRGTGINGLLGIPAIVEYSKKLSDACNISTKTIFIRPLLKCQRQEIYQYASKKIIWIEDPSNNNLYYTRNQIRTLFRSQIKQLFPSYLKSINRLSRIAGQYQRLAVFLADQDIKKLSLSTDTNTVPESINRNGLRSLDVDRMINLLRRWIQLKELLLPSERKINELIKQICSMSPFCTWQHEKHVLVISKNIIFWSSKNKIQLPVFKKPQQDITTQIINISNNVIQEISQTGKIKIPLKCWPATVYFRHVSTPTDQTINMFFLEKKNLFVMRRQGKERMKTKIGGSRKSLKNLFQQHHIPVESRDLPILYSDDRIIFVPFIGIDLEWAKMTREFNKEKFSFYVEVAIYLHNHEE